ncbi:hypothetical protein OEZ60_03545 [Defluviimonas sp. WL0024]|uniref:Uncharacterized protein n=1 Tax=Albidovulum salinarum TaxID=2984153 RepID=A0ABT2X063_9RHOB|nr:hypothetical protein [Defluviimonas sp. WL0024]MCU9847070.1 hypothetical protein [Defluviimonas sp. WL0024]
MSGSNMSGMEQARRVSVAALAAVTLAAGGALAADCPVAADLSTGIAAEYADGGRVDYRDAGEGRIAIFEPDSDGSSSGLVFLSRAGLYDLVVARRQNGVNDPERSLTLVYSEPEEDLPNPEPGGAWLGTVDTVFPGGAIDTDTAVYVFGSASDREIGGCRYATLAVKASFIGPVDWVAQDFIYFTDIGIAVPTARRVAGAERPSGRALARLIRLPR